jgi:hypothetical protein
MALASAKVRSCRQPRNRRRAQIIAAPDLSKRFLVPVTPRERLGLLMIGELVRSAHLYAARLRPLAALAGAPG